MKGIIRIKKGIEIETEKGLFNLHESSFGRHLKNYRDGDEVNVVLTTQKCPYNYTSRCTQGRCDCDIQLYAKLN